MTKNTSKGFLETERKLKMRNKILDRNVETYTLL